MNILIINSVPVNGGDEALLEASVELIKNKYKNSKVDVLCFNPDFCTHNTPGYKFDWDWEYVKDKNQAGRGIRAILKILNNLGITYFDYYRFTLEKKRVYLKLINADVIFTSAGGYLHDFYDITERISTLKFLIKNNKKIIFLPQSIGPFWKNDSKKQMSEILPKVYAIYVREKKSMQNIIKIEKDYNVQCVSKVTPDIAFYLHKKYSNLFIKKEKKTPVKIICCFRKWGSDDELIINNARKIISELIEKHGLNITFLSTCQGIDGYINDAEFADIICKELTTNQKNKILNIREHLHPEEFIKRASQFDAYIGMRLHGSILSMLAGIPAFNIAYEDKSTGIYADIGLSENCIYYNEPVENILKQINSFIQNLNLIPDKLKVILEEQCNQLEVLLNDKL